MEPIRLEPLLVFCLKLVSLSIKSMQIPDNLSVNLNISNAMRPLIHYIRELQMLFKILKLLKHHLPKLMLQNFMVINAKKMQLPSLIISRDAILNALGFKILPLLEMINGTLIHKLWNSNTDFTCSCQTKQLCVLPLMKQLSSRMVVHGQKKTLLKKSKTILMLWVGPRDIKKSPVPLKLTWIGLSHKDKIQHIFKTNWPL